MKKEFVVNTARPLAQLGDEVYGIFISQPSRAYAKRTGAHWHWLEDDNNEKRRVLFVSLGPKDRLKIGFGENGSFDVQFQKEQSDKTWMITKTEVMEPNQVLERMNQIITSAVVKTDKQFKSKLRMGLAAAAVGGGLLLAKCSGDANGAELERAPNQEPVAEQHQHLEL